MLTLCRRGRRLVALEQAWDGWHAGDGGHGEGIVGGEHPGVVEDLAQLDAARRVDPQALRHQVLALGADLAVEAEPRRADLLVRLEGDVAADHVVEEDAQRPHGGLVAVVLVALDPLRRGVHTGPCNEDMYFNCEMKMLCRSFFGSTP